MPFFEDEFWKGCQQAADNLHPFWSNYREIYKEGLTERESQNIDLLDFIFFEKRNNLSDEQANANTTSLSAKAMRSALFIMLYRDFPVFQTSYQILDNLIEIDHQMAGWRHKHLVMVRRMIGMRTGTGGSTGAGYLEGALAKHNIFRDIEGLSTFLIERKKLPKLPQELIKKLSYSS
jgi:tryptophan 2,3-dioxygenase